jgi:hypothetical protein
LASSRLGRLRSTLLYLGGVRRLGLTALLLLAVAAPAAAVVEPLVKHANLDGDSAKETVRVSSIGPKSGFQRTQVRVADSCPAAVNRRIAPVHDNLQTLRFVHADRRRGAEIFLVFRDGARSALGEARLVAWRPHPGEQCRAPKALFDYDTDRHTRTPKGGNGDIAFFEASIRNITKRYRGPEIAIDERFTTASDPPSFGSLKKVTYWRYSQKRDKYVRYETVQKEVAP